jgi:hypothetical protein
MTRKGNDVLKRKRKGNEKKTPSLLGLAWTLKNHQSIG